MSRGLFERIASMNSFSDTFWKKYLAEKSESNEVTWYHASAFDLRPLVGMRILANWRDGGDEIDCGFREAGAMLRNTAIIYSDNDLHFYEGLIQLCSLKKEDTQENRREFFRATGFNPKVKDVFTWNHLLSIEPFSLFSRDERAALRPSERYRPYTDRDGKLRDYDGFLLKISWFTCFQELFDVIVYFCLHDEDVIQVLGDYGMETLCMIENAAGYEGSPAYNNFFETGTEMYAPKFILTDHYEYDEYYGRHILKRCDYPSIFSRYTVRNFIRDVDRRVDGRFDGGSIALLPIDSKEVAGYHRGFCLAVRDDPPLDKYTKLHLRQFESDVLSIN